MSIQAIKEIQKIEKIINDLRKRLEHFKKYIKQHEKIASFKEILEKEIEKQEYKSCCEKCLSLINEILKEIEEEEETPSTEMLLERKENIPAPPSALKEYEKFKIK